jgi:hypothetical protein
VLIWLRRTAGLVLALAAAGGVVSFAAPPHRDVTTALAVPRPVPAPRPVLAPRDPEYAIAYQRGYAERAGGRVLVERWVLAGTAFRERVTAAGVLLSDRSDGIEVDYGRREWRVGPVRGLTGDCARTGEEITSGLAAGTVTESGPGVPVRGAATTVFRHHGKPAVDVWVNTTTHSPVRCRVVTRHAVVFDLVWLPATDANLAQLVAVVPDGFTLVVTHRS